MVNHSTNENRLVYISFSMKKCQILINNYKFMLILFKDSYDQNINLTYSNCNDLLDVYYTSYK